MNPQSGFCIEHQPAPYSVGHDTAQQAASNIEVGLPVGTGMLLPVPVITRGSRLSEERNKNSVDIYSTSSNKTYEVLCFNGQ